MNIGIIGQACIDEIISASGETRSRSLGGIFYSYAALERLASESTKPVTITPLGFSSRPDREFLTPFYQKLKHFDLSQLRPTDALTNRVQLVYHTDSDRTEHCPTILPTLGIERLDRDVIDGLDAIFINMISGFDISLEALQQLSEWSDETGMYIHLDLHALALGPLSQGSSEFGGGRKAQGLAQWQDWIACADSIQMNELEADHIGDPEFVGQAQLIEQIHTLRGSGKLPRLVALILTRAANGATIYDCARRTETQVPAPEVKVIDSTGSGDVFGAAYTYHLANGAAIESATRKSIKLATWNTQLTSLEEILTAER